MGRAFDEHESQREPSIEFRACGPSPWTYAQEWAQCAIDRPEGAPLPEYKPRLDMPPDEVWLSFAVGVSLGRFGSKGEGILHVAGNGAVPAAIMFIGPTDTLPDSLRHVAFAPVASAWKEHSAAILDGKKLTLRDWLRKDFFAYHKTLYENRPIYFPLSSEKRSFVA